VVHTPYTAFFADAFMAAHVAIGVMLMALAWAWLSKHVIARTLLAMTSPLIGDFLRGFGAKTPPLQLTHEVLFFSSCCIFFAAASMRRILVSVVTLLVGLLLTKFPDWFDDSMSEICALHLVWVGIALGLLRRRGVEAEPRAVSHLKKHPLAHDLLIFGSATLVAVFVSTFVLQRADGSADEWAYTWQAAAFARLHAYGAFPPCEKAFQAFYVFPSMGRLFSQYTPGWPYFMAPFVLFGVPWLAGPVSHGFFALGAARVARSAVWLDGRGTAARASAAAVLAAGVATFSATTLLLGASRYAHVFVAALFAWGIEASLVLRTETDPKRKVRWGFVLGLTVALMGATRPADGATLAMGLFFYFLYNLVRRRIGLRPFGAATLGLLLVAGLTLVILRLQLGEWLKTGYSLYASIHTWDQTPKYVWPRPSEWKFALPLATGSYAWFPCLLALGFGGIVSLRRAAGGVLFMMVVSFLAFEVHYQWLSLARNWDWGYGPRYETPLVVIMAVGTGVALAPLAESARQHTHAMTALQAGGPIAVVLCMIMLTLVRLWPLLYPGIYAHVHAHDALNERIRETGIHNAVVMAAVGTTGFDPLDLTENLPIDLYPNQDVLIAIERKPEWTQCIRTGFPGRAIYRATGNPPVITPYN
jgi:hypothetical protein